MPTSLKGWVDQVVRIDKTFTFDLARGDFPLEPVMSGKKLVLLTASYPNDSALPGRVGMHLSLTTLRENLIKIGAKVVKHSGYVMFQLAEVAIPRRLFAEILRLIDGLRPKPATT